MPAKPRTPQRANTMLDKMRARALAPVPDLPAEAPAAAPPAAEPAATPAQPAAAMPAQQPKQPRQQRQRQQQQRQQQRQTPQAGAEETQTFPVRITQTMTKEHARQLRRIMVEQNERLDDLGHEQVYTVTGLIRAAVYVCLSDPKLTARMTKAAGEPRLSGRGGIGTRR